MKQLKKLVFRLAQSKGTSGDETGAAVVAMKELVPYGVPRRDTLGNVLCTIAQPKKGKAHILLDAHLDEIGMIVTHIGEKGFLRVAAVGGVDTRVLASSEVLVHGRDGDYLGLVTSTPPHLLEDPKLLKKADEISKVWIDVGFSREEAEKRIRIGDRVTLVGPERELAGDRVLSKALDDRSGCAAILRALELLKASDLNGLGLSVSFTSREETGSQGTATAAFQLEPTEAIVVDVTPSDQDFLGKEKVCAIGDGVAIGFSPVLDRELSEKLIRLAEQEKIPYTVEVMGRSTGTNADDITVSRCGVKTATLSIPQRYAHTAVEIIALEDLEHTAKLIAAYVKERAGV